MVVDGLADHLTHSAPDTGFLHHGQMQRREIHRKGIRRTLRHTGMATLAGRAESMRNLGDSHSNLVNPADRQQCVRPTRSDAGEVFAQQTGRLIDEEHRGAVGRMYRDRAGQTGRDAIVALGTPFKKHFLPHRPRGAQPVRTSRRRSRHRRHTVRLFDELMRGSDGRKNRIFQEISPAV